MSYEFIMLTAFLLFVIWVLFGFAYYVIKMLGSWGRTSVTLNLLEKIIVAPAHVLLLIVKR